MDKIMEEMKDDIRRKFNLELFELSVEFVKGEHNVAKWENYVHPVDMDSEAKVYWTVWQKGDKLQVYYGMTKYEMTWITGLEMKGKAFAERVLEVWTEGVEIGLKNTPVKNSL